MTHHVELIETIFDCMSIAFELESEHGESVTIETTAGDLEKWTSLTHIKLIVELEKRLGIEFDDNEIVELGSVKKILQSIKQKCQ